MNGTDIGKYHISRRKAVKAIIFNSSDDLLWLQRYVEPDYGAMDEKDHRIAQWFRANLIMLPQQPFRLPDGRPIGTPMGWYWEITKALTDWSAQRESWRDVIRGWVGQLQERIQM